MLATIAASEAGPPVPLGAAPTPYTKVVATGRFDHGREALLGSRCAAPPSARICWCRCCATARRRCWSIAAGCRSSATAAVDHPRARLPSPAMSARPMSATGTARRTTRPGGASTSSTPRRSARRWTCRRRRPSAWWRWRRRGRRPRGLPAAPTTLPRPNNPHLGYAITWYGLAAALVGVLMAFMRPVVRERWPACPSSAIARDHRFQLSSKHEDSA